MQSEIFRGLMEQSKRNKPVKIGGLMWISRFPLNRFMKILLLRPWLCKVTQKIIYSAERVNVLMKILIWILPASNGFGSLLLNPKSCLKYGIICCQNQIPLNSWANLLWKQAKFKSLFVHKKLIHLACFALLLYIEKLRFVFTVDFKRTLMWAIIHGKGCWLSLFFSGL